MKKLLITVMIFISIFIIDEAWAQNSESMAKDFFKDPVGQLLSPEGGGQKFLIFVIGIAIYAIFVWYFYRFISRRDLLPKFFYRFSAEETPTIAKRAGYAAIYGVAFPLIVSVGFVVLAFFVFMIADGMPMEIAIFVSMSIVAAVRILSYYREDAAKEVAKMVPYAILAFLLTTVAIYDDPNFITAKEISSTPTIFLENIEVIVFAIVMVSIFEYSLRFGFIIKRKYRPVADKILEDEVDESINEKLAAHFKKLEFKEKELEKKIENKTLEFKKLEDKEKELEKKLEEKQKKLAEDLERRVKK